MITILNKFEDNNLVVNLNTAEDGKTICLDLSHDVDFKPVVEVLIEMIPNNEGVEFSFEPDDTALTSKQLLIKETIAEIYNCYNEIQGKPIIENAEVLEDKQNAADDEDLPF